MTRISRNQQILDHITFLTIVPAISQSGGRALGQRPGHLQASFITRNMTLFSAETKLGPMKTSDKCDQKFRYFHHGWGPCSRTNNCQVQEVHIAQPGCLAPLSFPGLCPAVFCHSHSYLTKPTHHASYTSTSLLTLIPYNSGCPTPSTLFKFYFSSSNSIFFPLINPLDSLSQLVRASAHS